MVNYFLVSENDEKYLNIHSLILNLVAKIPRGGGGGGGPEINAVRCLVAPIVVYALAHSLHFGARALPAPLWKGKA